MGGSATTQRSTPQPTPADLLDRGRAAGLAAVGITSAAIQQPAREILHLRRRAGRAGTMQFTYRNPDRSTDPTSVLPSARSIIVGAWAYGQWRAPDTPADPGGSAEQSAGSGSGRVARYAWHDHYGDLRAALETMAEPLRRAGHKAVVVADGNGLVDRNAAWSAGLGWYGKNSNLLLPGAGSWFVLGAVVTNADLNSPEPVRPQADGCGSCHRCLDDCPTGAIVAPGVVDATRCLAWLVQADGEFPRRWRVELGDRLYGCDDCQDVCPPNRQPAQPSTDDRAGEDRQADRQQVEVELDWVLTATDDEILDRHGRWYIAGRNVDNVRRSALVVLGNVAEPGTGDPIGLLRRYLDSSNPVLRGHAVWAARRLGLTALASAAADDPDPDVRSELDGEVVARFGPADWDLDVTAVTDASGTDPGDR
ncbi:MAG: tRNA epoxyqueuosine(34) reductase QueG [Actinomycetota bacterium]